MNLLRPWRWLRAAIIELTGIAACLLLIGYSHTERTPQPNDPPAETRDALAPRRDAGEDAQPAEKELWQLLGVVLEEALE